MNLLHRLRFVVLIGLLVVLTTCARPVAEDSLCTPRIPLSAADRAALHERFDVTEAQICAYTEEELRHALADTTQSPESDASRVDDAQNSESVYEDPDMEENPTGEAPEEMWIRSRMQDENGLIPANGISEARRQIDRMQAVQGRTAALGRGLWQFRGPTNIGGRIRTMIIHPTNPSVMYVGGVRGGVWKTIDGGVSWAPLDDFLPNLSVTALMFDPTNPNIIWAGTGEDEIGGGMYRSENAGASWSVVPGTSGDDFRKIRRMAISVVAGVTRITVATSVGIYQTRDGGAHWAQATSVTDIPALEDFWDIEQDPASPNNMIASSNTNGAAMWYSRDAGVTWTLATVENIVWGRIELAYAPSNPTIVYASVQNLKGALYKSTDGGQTYALVNNHQLLGPQGFHNNALWVDPTDPNRIMFGGLDVYRSTDGGVSLQRISDWTLAPSSAHADQHWFVQSPGFDGSTNRTVYVTNDGGVYRMGDYLTTTDTVGWKALNNQLAITQFYGIAAEVTSGALIGGTQDNGNLKLSNWDARNEWWEFFGGDGGYVAIDQHAPYTQYHEYVYLKLLGRRSATGGGTDLISGDRFVGDSIVWKERPYHIPDAKNSGNGVYYANFIAPFALDPNDSKIMYAGGKTLWRTTDLDAPVTNLTGPAWYAVKASSTTPISAIAVAPNHSDVVWVGDNDGGLWKSTNARAAYADVTWSNVSAVLPNRYVNDLWIDPNNSAHVFVTFGGFSEDNVWETTDAGATWSSISGSDTTALPKLPVYTIAVHPNNPRWIYVGTELGVFASEDGGAHWATASEGPTNAPVFDMTWMGTSLFIGTHGRGVFSIDIAPPTITSVTMAKVEPRTLRYTVVFSKAVVGVDVTDFAVVKSSGVSAAVSTVSGSGTTYTVDLVVSSGIGVASLGLATSPTISDATGQAFSVPGSFETQGCVAFRTGLACSTAVTSTADSGVGSLRQLIADLPSGSTIVFSPALSEQTITLTSALVLTKSMTIDATLTDAQITINGGGTTGLFAASAPSVTLNGLHMTNGFAFRGGAISNTGTVTIRNSSIANTRSSGDGTIYNSGTLTLVNSTVYGNTASTGMVINNIPGATMTIINATISGNASTSYVLQNTGALTMKNSIIADSTGSSCFSSAAFGTLSMTQTLIEDKPPKCPTVLGGNPRLATAALNGGTTYSNALLSGSSAINAGDNSVCASALVGNRDQRGALRPAGARCDIGAYEANGVVPTATAVRVATATRTITMTRTRTRTATPRPPARTATRTPTRRAP